MIHIPHNRLFHLFSRQSSDSETTFNDEQKYYRVLNIMLIRIKKITKSI